MTEQEYPCFLSEGLSPRMPYALIYDLQAGGVWSGSTSALDAELAGRHKVRPIATINVALVDDPPGVARSLEQFDPGDFDGTTVVVASLTETDRDDLAEALEERAARRSAH